VYYVNLIHNHIDIFDSNHDRTESLVQWHNTIKGKIPLIYDALCKATDQKNTRCQTLHASNPPFNLAHFRDTSMMMPFFAWKNISYGTGTPGKEP
jgi:hypothetical protein